MLNQFYARNLVKEGIQNDILNFVYQDSEYQNLIFTGGTCLRKLYGLDRLSEDLDFDYASKFDIDKFAAKIKSYFVSKLQYKKVEFRISSNRQTLFITVFKKTPDFKSGDELNADMSSSFRRGNRGLKSAEDVIKLLSENIFVRCDFSRTMSKVYGLNKGMITAGKFRFLVNAYDLETMFANKIVAFLRRNFYKGKFQTLPLKGRDVYDLFWFLQLSAKSGYSLRPNQKRLLALTGDDIASLRQEIRDKIQKVKAETVYEDMLPLVESDKFLREFLKVFNTNIVKQIDMVM